MLSLELLEPVRMILPRFAELTSLVADDAILSKATLTFYIFLLSLTLAGVQQVSRLSPRYARISKGVVCVQYS